MEQIRIVKLVNGDDIVCSLAPEQLPTKSLILRLVKPLQIKYVSQLTARGLKDYIALIKWTAYTNDHIISIPKDKIMTITNATEEMSKSYLDVSSKYDRIDIPKKGQYITEELSKEENDEFNELWDEFRDKERILH
jgi:hypothetical protein